MSVTKKVRRAAITGVAAVALAGMAALIPAGTAVAAPLDTAASPIPACGVGMVPIVVDNTIVRSGPSVTAGHLYTLESGRAFRITGGPIQNDGILWWFGHGNGLPDGWTPNNNLSCR